MIKNVYRKSAQWTVYVVFVATIFGFIFLFSPANLNRASTATDELRANALAKSYQWAEILERFDSYDWRNVTTPELLMVYCRALAEEQRPVPANLRVPIVPNETAAFAKSFHDLASGKLVEGRQGLEELAKIPTAQYWAYVGLFEYGAMIGNVVVMEEALERLGETIFPDNEQRVRRIANYQLRLDFVAENFRKVDGALAEQGELLEPELKILYQIRLDIRSDHFSEAERSIEQFIQQFGASEDVLLAKAEIIQVRDGPSAAIEFLVSLERRFPKLFWIKAQYANMLAEAGRVGEALAKFRDIAERRQHDVMLQTEFLAFLSFYGHDKKGLLSVYNSLRDQIAVPYYNVVLARIQFSLDQKEEMEASLMRAKYQSSNIRRRISGKPL